MINYKNNLQIKRQSKHLLVAALKWSLPQSHGFIRVLTLTFIKKNSILFISCAFKLVSPSSLAVVSIDSRKHKNI